MIYIKIAGKRKSDPPTIWEVTDDYTTRKLLFSSSCMSMFIWGQQHIPASIEYLNAPDVRKKVTVMSYEQALKEIVIWKL